MIFWIGFVIGAAAACSVEYCVMTVLAIRSYIKQSNKEMK